jgi:pimeloyl-ACP methyl ester carboxylesterase
VLFDAKEWVIELPDHRMNCIAFGRGKRPLVMIQGLNTRGIKGAALPMAYMYRIFARDFRVYLFDRREKVDKGVTVRELAADIAGAMDALGIQNADVLGVSQGGMIAQYLAIDRPDLVRKMVLALTLSRNNAAVERVIRNWIEMTKRGDMKALVADMADKMYSNAYMKRYRPLMPLLTILQKPRDTARFITLAEACLTCNAYEELERLVCPVLVIGARQDQVVTGEASEEIAERLHCRLHMYEELGHVAYEEAKDFNRLVYDFLIE